MIVRMLDENSGERIAVYDTDELYGERGAFRVLQFADDAVQGAMDLRRPERIVLEYPEAMLHLMERHIPAFEDVFVIGHGIGTLPGRLKQKRCVVADIDRRVVQASRDWFAYDGPEPRIGDGRELLERELSDAYDFVVVDAFTSKGTPERLTTFEWFETVREKLQPNGAVLLNLAGRSVSDPFLHAVRSTLGAVFPHTIAFALPGATARTNVLLAAGAKPFGYAVRQMRGFREVEWPDGFLLRDRGS